MSSKSCAKLKIISSYCWSSCSVKPIIAQTPSFGRRNVYCVIPQVILPPPPPSIFFWHFPSSITIALFTICSILPMFWSSNIRLSIYLGSSVSHKTYQQTLFVQLIYSFFSCYHVTTNGVAPFSAYKDTHNPQFLYSLWHRANAPNFSFETRNSGQFKLSTQLIIPNYLAILSQWYSTTVSLETYPL